MPRKPKEQPSVRIGLILSIVLVLTIARVLSSDAGTDTTPDVRGISVAASVGMDLLMFIPALLILAGRVRRPTTRLGSACLFGPMFAFALLACASVIWASNKFFAAISASHWLAAMALLWATAQLIRDWSDLRLLGAFAFGLLVVNLAAQYEQHYIELPELKRAWWDKDEPKNRWDYMKEHNLTEEDFAFQQFERKIMNADLTPFTNSSNSFAAILVLLGTISAGCAIQRWRCGDPRGWVIPFLIVLPIFIWGLILTHGMAGGATAVLAALLLALLSIGRVRAGFCRFFWPGVGMVLAAMGAVIGHGLYHQSLPGKSLTFRWYYWVGSWRMFLQHPWRGVGWSNFGPSYLQVRLRQAPEEVKDPHNFLARSMAELGIFGALLMVAWMFLLWRRLSRPSLPPAAGRQYRLLNILGIALIGLFTNLLIGVDSSQAGNGWIWFLILEIFYRLVAALLLTLGLAITTLRTGKSEVLDDRPAPWILYAMIIGLGMFLIHNLIEFSLFEPGPMFLFALFCGGAVGARLNFDPGPPRRALAAIILTLGVIGWFVIAIGLWVPTVRAQSLAAVGKFEEAADVQPWQTGYLLQAARETRDLDHARELIGRAIAGNPLDLGARFARAELESHQNPMDRRLFTRSYEDALGLDPANVTLRIEYADLLGENFHDDIAIRQGAELYRTALEYDDALPADEGKKMSAARRAEVAGKMHALEAKL